MGTCLLLLLLFLNYLWTVSLLFLLLFSSGFPLDNVLGVGLGYSLPSSETLGESNGRVRADGVSTYQVSSNM